MCMRTNAVESCELNQSVSALNERVDAIESRVTRLENRVDDLRTETRNGFSSVNANIETLSQQLTNMDRRLINDREKWHEVFRKAFIWVVRGGVIVVAYAAGVNITKVMIPSLFN